MGEVSIIGVDLAKNVFQVHGAAAGESVLFRKKLSRPQFARFMAEQPPCRVAMEACASAHHWAREMARHGREVRLIAPHYVKPFLKRQKNDAADAEAIVEAALRPTSRFVEPKTADQQARAIAFRTREQLVKQRTEAVNALRSHLYEFGHVAPTGIGFVPRLARVVEDPDTDMPELARDICRVLLEQIGHLTDRLKALKLRIEAMSNEAEMLRRQAEAGEDLEDGAARHSPIADHRRHGGDPMGHPVRLAKGLVAGPDAGTQTPVGGRGGAGKQDGARHLGDADAGRGLSWPGADRRLIGRRAGIVATEL